MEKGNIEHICDIVALNESYLQSLKAPENIYSGNRSLLKGDLRKLHREYVAEEKKFSALYDSGFAGMSIGDKNEAQNRFSNAKNAFHEAMTNLDNLRKGQHPAQDIEPAEPLTEGKKEQRSPQLVTVNGDKITHGHIFQSKDNEEWLFSCKMNGKQLPITQLTEADVTRFRNTSADIDIKNAVREVLEKYYPSKLQPRLSKEEFSAGNVLSDGRAIDKFAVYKENDVCRADFGKWKFFVAVGTQKMSRVGDRESLNAYFDRTQTPAQLTERLFGEKLHLASAYSGYILPADVSNIRIAKGVDEKWAISAEIAGARTPKRQVSYDDLTSYFQTKAASKEQLAAKYLSDDFTALREMRATYEKRTSMTI